MLTHMIPPGYITDLIRNLNRWRRRRLGKELTVKALDEAIEQIEKYRELSNSVLRLRTWIKAELTAIESDSRYQDEPALVAVNAPLALVQFAMTERHQALTQFMSQLGIKWAPANKVPDEVREMVNFTLDGEEIPDDHIRWALKELTSRGDAWLQCEMPARLSLEDHGCSTGDCPHETQAECNETLAEFQRETWTDRNPWRKAHTENFWAWYRTNKESD